jgi:uncharacterized protein YbaA (DUF1428 family)
MSLPFHAGVSYVGEREARIHCGTARFLKCIAPSASTVPHGELDLHRVHCKKRTDNEVTIFSALSYFNFGHADSRMQRFPAN